MTLSKKSMNLKKLFREIAKLTKKCVHLKCACEFIQTCSIHVIFTKCCQIIYKQYARIFLPPRMGRNVIDYARLVPTFTPNQYVT